MDFKETRGSLPPLHKPAIDPYLQHELSNHQDPTPPPSNPFQYYPPIYASSFKKVSILQTFPLKLCMHFWIAPYVHMLGEKYNACSSALCNFLHSPVISSLLASNIFLSTLFSNTLNLCSILNVRDQVSQLCNTVCSIIILYALSYFLESKRDGKIFSSE